MRADDVVKAADRALYAHKALRADMATAA
jgi:hypothetical protein